MARRGRFGRFVRRVRTSRPRRAARRMGRLVLRGVRRVGGAISAPFPGGLKPSKFAATTGVAVSGMKLVFKPLPNGDSWMRRIMTGWSNYKQSQDPIDLLAYDPDGNGVLEIATYQLEQNAPGSILTLIGYGLGAGALRYVGM